ncbi:ATP-binding cassette subfamily C protein CydD [Paracoccus sulfuroxidans]|uniref:ATP-binding cassette subfamily C protein CydD n=1 Tax=Paracoccus sulfuroxidans TaxID=384678 RepID=A0A562NQX1_9RHOB|nr:ATP-binding cassette subfamily C protein CydD [Paracoccus sulfuroxidans]
MEQDGAERGAARRLLAPEARALRLAALLSVIAHLCWLPMAGCAAWVLAGLVEGRGVSLGVILGFVACGLARGGLNHLAEGVAQRAALGAVTRLRGELLQVVSGRAVLPRAGALALVAGDQAAAIVPYAVRYGMGFARAAVVPLVILLCAFAVSWAAGLILLLTGPVIPVFMALVGHAAGRASRAQFQEMSSLGALLADRVAALPDIRLLGAGQRLRDEFGRAAEALRARTMQVLGIAFLSSTVLELFAALGVAIMAVFCGFSLLGHFGFGMWGAPLSVGQALFLLMIAPEFYQPLRDLAAAWHDRASADAAAALIAQEMAEAPAMPGLGAPAVPLAVGGIALRGLRHRGIAYPDLDLRAGEALVLTGPSGSGKSTLLRLLAGLEAPEAGQVLVAGQALDAQNADAWRAGLGWMPQAVHFLDASLEENLRMGRAGDLDAALRSAAADHLPEGLPEGQATRLGERGAGLSGGEARRLTLARALYGAPGWILADEPTADLDAGTAERVAQGLLAAHRGGAGLIVATHDPALIAAIGREYRLGAP